MKSIATSILLGLFAIASTASADHHKEEKKSKTIVETAVAAGSFKTLAAALLASLIVAPVAFAQDPAPEPPPPAPELPEPQEFESPIEVRVIENDQHERCVAGYA